MAFKVVESDEDTQQREGHNLSELAMVGVNPQVEEAMRQEVERLNTEYKNNGPMKAAIVNAFRAEVPALFANEVKVESNGSLVFTPNKTSSPELKKNQETLLKDLAELYALRDSANIPGMMSMTPVLSNDKKAVREEAQRVFERINNNR